MANRKIQALIPLVAMWALVALGCDEPPELGPPEIGTRVPQSWIVNHETGDSATTFVAWLFRTEDCLDCQDFDYQLRRVQAKYADGIPFIAVHVGSVADSMVPRQFFERRRLDARLVHMTPGSHFTSEAADWFIPALFLVRDARVVWAASPVATAGEAIPLDSAITKNILASEQDRDRH